MPSRPGTASHHGKRTDECLDAARSGQAYEVEEAIHLGADVAASDPHGMTAMHYAASRGSITIVNVLLRYGAPLDQQDAAGMTPLHSAVIHDRSSVTMILIKAGCGVDIADARGCTPLHLAATSGQLALARILVEAAGASFQAKTRLQLTPLLCAVEKQQIETARYLADACRPPFILPAEPSDFSPSCPAPSQTLQRFLKTLPPRPSQAIQNSCELRIALGPQPRGVVSSVVGSDVDGVSDDAAAAAAEVKEVMAERAAAIEAMERRRAEEEMAPLRDAAVVVVAAVRRLLVRPLLASLIASERQKGERGGAELITAAVSRRLCQSRFRMQSTAAKVAGAACSARLGRERLAKIRRGVAMYEAVVMRTRCVDVLDNMRYAQAAVATNVIEARLRGAAVRRAYAKRLSHRSAGQALLPFVLRHRAMAALAQHRLVEAARAREEAEERERERGAEEARAKAEKERIDWDRAAADAAERVAEEEAAATMSRLDRRRGSKPRLVKPAVSVTSNQHASCAAPAPLWLPLFAVDEPDEPATRRPSEEANNEEMVDVGGGVRVSIARPLSSKPRPGVAAASSAPPGTAGSGSSSCRPRTAGGSRDCDTDASVSDVAKRWCSAAENLDIFADHALAQAAVDNMIGRGDRWMSGGFKCWLEVCIARRGGVEVDDQALKGSSNRLASMVESAAAGSVSMRQRVCAAMHLGYMQSRLGDHSGALKSFTLAKNALSEARPSLQKSSSWRSMASTGAREMQMPPPAITSSKSFSGSRAGWSTADECAEDAEEAWPCVLSLMRPAADVGDGEDDEAWTGHAECGVFTLLAVAHCDSAVCLLNMGAQNQALMQAEAAARMLSLASPISGKGSAAGVAWIAQAEIEGAVRRTLDASRMAVQGGGAADGQDPSKRADADVLKLDDDKASVESKARAQMHDADADAEEGKENIQQAGCKEVPKSPAPPAEPSKGQPSPARASVSKRVDAFATTSMGRLGAFGLGSGILSAGLAPSQAPSPGGTGPIIMGGVRMSSGQVASDVASLLDNAGGDSSSSGSSFAMMGGKTEFGRNGATWHMAQGARPVSASRRTLGFDKEIGRHAPSLPTASTPSLARRMGALE